MDFCQFHIINISFRYVLLSDPSTSFPFFLIYSFQSIRCAIGDLQILNFQLLCCKEIPPSADTIKRRSASCNLNTASPLTNLSLTIYHSLLLSFSLRLPLSPTDADILTNIHILRKPHFSRLSTKRCNRYFQTYILYFYANKLSS